MFHKNNTQCTSGSVKTAQPFFFNLKKKMLWAWIACNHSVFKNPGDTQYKGL